MPQKLVIETCQYMKVNMDKPGGLCSSHRREMQGLLLQTDATAMLAKLCGEMEKFN